MIAANVKPVSQESNLAGVSCFISARLEYSTNWTLCEWGINVHVLVCPRSLVKSSQTLLYVVGGLELRQSFPRTNARMPCVQIKKPFPSAFSFFITLVNY